MMRLSGTKPQAILCSLLAKLNIQWQNYLYHALLLSTSFHIRKNYFHFSGPLSKLCRGAVMMETFGMWAAKKLIIPSMCLIPVLSRIRHLKNCTHFHWSLSCTHNWSLSNWIFFSLALARTCLSMWSCSSLFTAAIIMSSATVCLPGIPEKASSFLFLKNFTSWF